MSFLGFEGSAKFYQGNITNYSAQTLVEYYIKLTVTITMVGEPPAQWDEYAFSDNYNYTVQGSSEFVIDPIRWLFILYLEYPEPMDNYIINSLLTFGVILGIIIIIGLSLYYHARKSVKRTWIKF